MRTATADMFDLGHDEPIILVGEPRSVRGLLRLRNKEDEAVSVRGAALRGSQEEDGPGFPGAHVAFVANLQPGQASQSVLTLELDPRCPPGEYHLELELAGHAHPAIVHVTEVVRLDIAPATLVFDQAAGSKTSKCVIFSNLGNVDLKIGEIGGVPLFEDDLREQSLGAVLAEPAGRPSEAEAVGQIEVRVPGAPLVLKPGGIQPVDLEISLPAAPKKARYRGVVPLYTSDLTFVFVPP